MITEANAALSTSREKLRSRTLEILKDAPRSEKSVRSDLLLPSQVSENLPPRKRKTSSVQLREAENTARALHDFSKRRFAVRRADGVSSSEKDANGTSTDELQKILRLPEEDPTSEVFVVDARGGGARWQASHFHGKNFAVGCQCEARDVEEIEDATVDAAWFRATIVDRRLDPEVPLEEKGVKRTDSPKPKHYLIEYRDFVEDDATKVPLRAVIHADNVRPPVPNTGLGASRVKALGAEAQAEAEWQDGWYPAALLEYDSKKDKATVQFRASRAIEEVEGNKVRVACDYDTNANCWKVIGTGQPLPWI